MLATLIRTLHIFLILFVLLGAFLEDPIILLLHFTTCFTILIHWRYNDNTCALTLMESKLRGIPAETSFMYSLVSPVYTPSFSIDKGSILVLAGLGLWSGYKTIVQKRVFSLMKAQLMSK